MLAVLSELVSAHAGTALALDLGAKGRHLLEQQQLAQLDAQTSSATGHEVSEYERGMWLQEAFNCLDALGQWHDIRIKVGQWAASANLEGHTLFNLRK